MPRKIKQKKQKTMYAIFDSNKILVGFRPAFGQSQAILWFENDFTVVNGKKVRIQHTWLGSQSFAKSVNEMPKNITLKIGMHFDRIFQQHNQTMLFDIARSRPV